MNTEVEKKLTKLFARYPLQTESKSHILIHSGDDPVGVFFLVEGKIKQYDISDSGNEVIVNIFKENSFFPMSWALNKTENPYFYEVYSARASFRQAPAEVVLSFMKANPDVMFDLLSRLSSGAAGLQRRMAHLMAGTSYSRVMYELVIEARRFGKKTDQETFELKLTEEDMASRAGLSRETVSRTVKKLKDEGLLDVSHGIMKVHKLSKLEQKLGSSL